MAETKILKKEEDKDDRLSSLPDEILTNILSFLPIHSAVTTSVLSHRWCHLWTGVTRFNFFVSKEHKLKSSAIVDRVLNKLTSRKLHNFVLDMINRNHKASWFRDVYSRNVENITFNVSRGYSCIYHIPSFLFNSQSLVTLNLYGCFHWPRTEDLRFHLPNLKKLVLDYLDNIPLWLETLIRFSPILEYLDLFFILYRYSDLSTSVVNIIAPNLKSLSINMEFQIPSLLLRTRVSIDAPKLANLRIDDCISIYYFLRNPITLVKSCINLKNNGDCSYCEEEEDEDEDEDEDMVDKENIGLLPVLQKEYTHQMTKFVGGLSSVSSLNLEQEFDTNIFRHCSSASMPIFSNLTRLETECPVDLLFSLHCFPNLEHLVVSLWPLTLPTLYYTMEQSDWLPPDSVPYCLASKLKTIQLSGVQRTGASLRVLAYILSHADVLEKLCIDFEWLNLINEHNEAHVMWMECQLCRSLFKLPRRSSTCEVVVSGNYVTASGNALQDGYLTCRMYVGD